MIRWAVGRFACRGNHETETKENMMQAILIHGWGGTPSTWDNVPFPADWTLHRYTLPGHGERFNVEGWTIPQAGEDLAAFVRDVRERHCNVEEGANGGSGREPVVLIAHSMGGQLSAWVNANHPELIDGEVVIDPAYNGTDTPEDIASMQGTLAELRADALGTMHEFVQGAKSPYLSDGAFDNIVADIDRTNPVALADYYSSEYLEKGSFGLMSHVREVTARRSKPVLGFYTIEARAKAEHACDPKGLPVATHVWTGGHGHFMHLEEPRRFADETADWVDEIVV